MQGCSDKVSNFEKVQSLVFKQDTDTKMSDRFSKFTFVQLETNDDCVIPDIRRIIDVSDTLVVLSNTGDIFTFDRNTGKYYGEISSKGEGPEEYVEASDIVVAPDHSIGIVDRLRGDIKFFTVNGTFIKEKKILGETAWLGDVELASDGKLLCSNKLCGGNPPQKYAYMLADVYSGERPRMFDSFAPVTVGDYSSAFAEKPITACDGELHFLKFMNDTLFSYKDDAVKALNVLATPTPFPSKDMVAKQGEFDISKLAALSRNGNFFIGFNSIYETKNILLLESIMPEVNGYYWVDKTAKEGYIRPCSPKIETMAEMLVEGKLVCHPVGSSDNEIIGYIGDELWFEEIKKVAQAGKVKPFNAKLKKFIEKIDVEGNPCLFIYSHK